MRIVLAALTFTWASVAWAQAPSFRGLGDLPGGESRGFYSFAWAVSDGGTVVVGESESAASPLGGGEPIRWSAEGGLRAISGPNGEVLFGEARDVTDDGALVVGWAYSRGGESFTWSADRGYVGLGKAAGFESTVADGVSADGNVVVGYAARAIPPTFESDIEAVRWTSGGGWQRLGKLGGVQSMAHGVSADGAVVVGSSSNGARWEAFRWTEASGMQRLEERHGSDARAISADGRVIAGTMYVRGELEENRGVLWLEDGGTVTLGFLPGRFPETRPLGLSRDGSIVVGTAAAGYGFFHEDRAFIWDAENGIRDVQELLVNELGLDLSGWALHGAWDVSSDGDVIVGYGTNPAGKTEAWMAVIPEPQSLAFAALGLLVPMRRLRPPPRRVGVQSVVRSS